MINDKILTVFFFVWAGVMVWLDWRDKERAEKHRNKSLWEKIRGKKK